MSILNIKKTGYVIFNYTCQLILNIKMPCYKEFGKSKFLWITFDPLIRSKKQKDLTNQKLEILKRNSKEFEFSPATLASFSLSHNWDRHIYNGT